MYPPIEDHGIIGNLRTAALVSLDGTIDFFCPVRFDNPSLFASLLDDEHGGFCSIRPESNHYRRKQLYLPDTNILMTRFLAPEGIAEIIDFIPLGGDPEQSTIIRQVSVTRGEMALRFECQPTFDYASECHHEISNASGGILFRSKRSGVLSLQSEVPLSIDEHSVASDFHLKAGERQIFLLSYLPNDSTPPTWQLSQSEQLLNETVRYWREWVAGCNYHGRWRETIIRSALLLKLLTYERTGAIVAAPTFGLPEEIGGVRNWDYRYTWLRDAAFSLNAFLRLGHHKEALQFMSWMKQISSKVDIVAAQRKKKPLPVMHAIDGEKDLREREISSLKGYRGSGPVRIGNAVQSQLQLDAPGAMLAVLFFEVNEGLMLEYDRWNKMREVLGWVAKMWDQPDRGIWEIRGEPRHFLHSKLMCWVAFDRAIKIAQLRSLPAPINDWLRTRDEIYASIHAEFWNDQIKAFVQSKGSAELDATALLMISLGFLGPSDPRWISTLEAVTAKLAQDTTVSRYDTKTGVDGLPGTEGTFSPCSFWYVNALTMSGELERARLVFEKMLGYSNHVGLYAEELGQSGEHLGNFPQALTHLALILSALGLNDALDGKGPIRSKAA